MGGVVFLHGVDIEGSSVLGEAFRDIYPHEEIDGFVGAEVLIADELVDADSVG